MFHYFILVASTVTVFALGSGTIKSDDFDLSLYANTSFVYHNLVLPDKVSYHASVSGEDTYLLNGGVKDIKVYVIPGTDKCRLDPVFLTYPSKLTRQGTNLTCNYGGSYAKLETFCAEAQGIVISND